MSTTTPPVDTSDAAPVGIPDAANESLADYGRRWWAGVRTGDLGSLPIVVGLILIAVIFQSQNSQFLTAGNFVNLIVQMAAITIIGMGIVFVLLLGEIDLSVGYVSRRRRRHDGAADEPRTATTSSAPARRSSSRSPSAWPSGSARG